MKYTASAVFPTGIPGYAPEYVLTTGVRWEVAYDFALAQARATTSPSGLTSFDIEPFHTALRDGAEAVALEVRSAERGVHLGRPFVPAVLVTIKVVADRSA